MFLASAILRGHSPYRALFEPGKGYNPKFRIPSSNENFSTGFPGPGKSVWPPPFSVHLQSKNNGTSKHGPGSLLRASCEETISIGTESGFVFLPLQKGNLLISCTTWNNTDSRLRDIHGFWLDSSNQRGNSMAKSLNLKQEWGHFVCLQSQAHTQGHVWVLFF